MIKRKSKAQAKRKPAMPPASVAKRRLAATYIDIVNATGAFEGTRAGPSEAKQMKARLTALRRWAGNEAYLGPRTLVEAIAGAVRYRPRAWAAASLAVAEEIAAELSGAQKAAVGVGTCTAGALAREVFVYACAADNDEDVNAFPAMLAQRLQEEVLKVVGAGGQHAETQAQAMQEQQLGVDLKSPFFVRPARVPPNRFAPDECGACDNALLCDDDGQLFERLVADDDEALRGQLQRTHSHALRLRSAGQPCGEAGVEQATEPTPYEQWLFLEPHTMPAQRSRTRSVFDIAAFAGAQRSFRLLTEHCRATFGTVPITQATAYCAALGGSVDILAAVAQALPGGLSPDVFEAVAKARRRHSVQAWLVRHKGTVLQPAEGQTAMHFARCAACAAEAFDAPGFMYAALKLLRVPPQHPANGVAQALAALVDTLLRRDDAFFLSVLVADIAQEPAFGHAAGAEMLHSILGQDTRLPDLLAARRADRVTAWIAGHAQRVPSAAQLEQPLAFLVVERAEPEARAHRLLSCFDVARLAQSAANRHGESLLQAAARMRRPALVELLLPHSDVWHRDRAGRDVFRTVLALSAAGRPPHVAYPPDAAAVVVALATGMRSADAKRYAELQQAGELPLLAVQASTEQEE